MLCTACLQDSWCCDGQLKGMVGKHKSKASATAAAHAASKKKSSGIEISARVEAQLRKALQVQAAGAIVMHMWYPDGLLLQARPLCMP